MDYWLHVLLGDNDILYLYSLTVPAALKKPIPTDPGPHRALVFAREPCLVLLICDPRRSISRSGASR